MKIDLRSFKAQQAKKLAPKTLPLKFRDRPKKEKLVFDYIKTKTQAKSV